MVGPRLGRLATDILAIKHVSRILRHCRDESEIHTSCFSFSSQYLNTEQEERGRPQSGQKDSADPAMSENPTDVL